MSIQLLKREIENLLALGSRDAEKFWSAMSTAVPTVSTPLRPPPPPTGPIPVPYPNIAMTARNTPAPKPDAAQLMADTYRLIGIVASKNDPTDQAWQLWTRVKFAIAADASTRSEMKRSLMQMMQTSRRR
jgi:hypothetical protein